MMQRSEKKYKNGIKHVHYHVPFLHTLTLSFIVNTGSCKETRSELFGISHFLEHMLFNGSQRYPDHKVTEKEVARMGIYQNAWTWNNNTVYYMNSPIPYIEKAFDILVDRVYRPLLRDEHVEKERGIIQEERVMGENDPSQTLLYDLKETMFKDTVYAHKTIGTKESIANFDKELLQRFHKVHYHPSNTVFVTYGGLAPDESEQLFGKYLEKIQVGKDDEFIPEYDSVLGKISEQGHLEIKKDVPAGFFQEIRVYDPPSNLKEYVNWMYLMEILSEGRSAILEKELKIKESLVSNQEIFIYFDGSYLNIAYEAVTDKTKLGKVIKKYNEVISMLVESISGQSITRAQGSLLGSFLSGLEDPFIISDTDMINIELYNSNFNTETSLDEIAEVIKTRKRSDIVDHINNIYLSPKGMITGTLK